MSKQIDNKQAPTQYLLGSLPEAETERLDELSFADDEFAETLKAVEKDLVDAYIQGELTGSALEQFKSYYLASPLRREKVEFAQAFQVFREQSAGTGAEVRTEAAPKHKGFSWFSALSRFTAPRLALQWGFAGVALVLLIAGGWLVFENVRLHQQASQTQARRDVLSQREQELQKELEGQRVANATTAQELANLRAERARLEQELKKAQPVGTDQQGARSIVSLILAAPMRGAGRISTITVLPQTEYVAAQLELPPADYSAYRVMLLDPASNRTLWRSGRVKARIKGDGKAISVNFSAGLLKPQNYILQVSGVSATGASEIVSDYPFKVVR